MKMKVFISWSGNFSKQVAEALREWLPFVINAIDPFLSAEDIEKGHRWNPDIARELQDSAYGIICVSMDNRSEAWLNFEAGALSKSIDTARVAPFLIDMQPSDLTGSPLAQFQATLFNRDDILKLVKSLNTACPPTGGQLVEQTLERAFATWWPQLEEKLDTILASFSGSKAKAKSDTRSTPSANDIMEDILDTSRNIQRLVGNTDTKLRDGLDELQLQVSKVVSLEERERNRDFHHMIRNFGPVMIEDMIVLSSEKMESHISDDVTPYLIPILLSPLSHSLPWVYDAGWQLTEVLLSECNTDAKQRSVVRFMSLIETVEENPMFREIFRSKEEYMLVRDFVHVMAPILERYISRTSPLENHDTANLDTIAKAKLEDEPPGISAETLRKLVQQKPTTN